jgi:CRISPR-associated protein Cmr5
MPNTTTLKGIEQGRAAYAYQCAKEGKLIFFNQAVQIVDNEISEDNTLKYDEKYYKDDKYKAYVKRFSMLVKTNGLGATVAFVLSKQKKIDKNRNEAGSEQNPKNAYDLIYNQIWAWLNREEKQYLIKRENGSLYSDFAEATISMGSNQYRSLTVEVLALFAWLRRYAEGLINSEDE